MQTPEQLYEAIKEKLNPQIKTAALTAFLLGLLIHLPVMIGDYPNHDGLDGMYFSQNMVTSGRWFLAVACSLSSFFSLPYVNGLISLLFLAISAGVLTAILKIEKKLQAALIAGLLVSFPALASTYGYIFTADGYMMGLCLAFLAVYFAEKGKKGWIIGGVCLSFSMGIYQSYLSFAILLSMYCCCMILWDGNKEPERKDYAVRILRYLFMGVWGVGLYYVLLQILLKLQGKVLDTYQGINGMAETSGNGIANMLKKVYADFGAFTLHSPVLHGNIPSLVVCILLLLLFATVLFSRASQKGCLKKPLFWLVLIVLLAGIPAASNVLLFISPDVTYHLLMRYQYVLLLILPLAFLFREDSEQRTMVAWGTFLTALVLTWSFGVTDNIAYSNLAKKYEKTYAYCLRLADRMEQTEGYYTGIPVAMIGVQSSENYPETDISGHVTDAMIGMNGDYLIYTSTNYQQFMRYYMGITVNPVSDEEMLRIYDTPEYRALNSFPAADSMKVVDGILYIKTE